MSNKPNHPKSPQVIANKIEAKDEVQDRSTTPPFTYDILEKN